MTDERLWPRDPATGRWRLLYDALKDLSLEPADQLDFALGDVNELGMCFGDSYVTMPFLRRHGIRFSPECLRELDHIDRLLTQISGRANEYLWEPTALLTSPQWAEIRLRARLALAVFPPPPAVSLGTRQFPVTPPELIEG